MANPIEESLNKQLYESVCNRMDADIEEANKRCRDLANFNALLEQHNTVLAENERLRRGQNVLQDENKRLKADLEDIRNREGACCPEDVAFDEHISNLQSKNKRLKAEKKELWEAIVGWKEIVDKLEAENKQLRGDPAGILNRQIEEVDKLATENKRLKESLGNLSFQSQCSWCEKNIAIIQQAQKASKGE